MVAAHVAWLHTESDLMVEHERRRDLALLYPLVRPLPSGLTPLVQKLTQHITQQGLQAIGPMQGENVIFGILILAKNFVLLFDCLDKLYFSFATGSHSVCRKHAGRALEIFRVDKGRFQR